jgi:drug/metabolite transporter (DMT)-like permease
MFWIFITIFANFLFAVAFIIDKHFVSNTKLKPVSYTFYSGIFQVLFLLLIPVIGFTLPETRLLIIGVFDGALFILALMIFYKALRASEASRVIPVVGAAVPIFTILLAYVVLGEFLTIQQFAAFVFFITGGLLISSKFDQGEFSVINGFLLAIVAGFFFALYYTLIKFIYLYVSFFDGFILLQIGGFLGALMLLASKKNREIIFSAPSMVKKKTASLFVPNKVLAALAAVMVFYAISIEGSNVAIISSLQSVQYVFVLLLAIILSKRLPSLYREQISSGVIVQKVVAIFIIGIGLALLVI